MKHKILYLLLFVIGALSAGCIKGSSTTPVPPTPSGTFNGEFKVLHRSNDKVPYDSLKTTLSVNFSTSDYTYSVTGDTTTLHAGSYGSFSIASPYIGFSDKTYSTTSPGTKWHLTGYYLYNYDGTNLIMYASSSDTLVIGYSLKKVTN
jgi:hypothetical protein